MHGGLERLHELLGRDVVAIAGARRPSDYGLRCARTLAREIAAAGVTVASIDDRLAVVTRAGALRASGETIVVKSSRARELRTAQCTLALLADLVIVVEAGEQPSDRLTADVARSRGIAVAAVPGQIDSPASYASNRLITEGALMLCSAEQALDVLGGVGVRRPHRVPKRRSPKPRGTAKSPGSVEVAISVQAAANLQAATSPKPHAAAAPRAAEPALEPRLASVLERVHAGEDTLAQLCLGERDCDELALALTELELIGRLQRAPDGRYLPSAGDLR